MLPTLAQPAPLDPDAADGVRQALGYLTMRATRVNYPGFVARHLPIGSGAIESTRKMLIEEREMGPEFVGPRRGPSCGSLGCPLMFGMPDHLLALPSAATAYAYQGLAALAQSDHPAAPQTSSLALHYWRGSWQPVARTHRFWGSDLSPF